MATRHPRNRKRNVIFGVVVGVPQRQVIFPDGRTYTHRCTRQVYEDAMIEYHALAVEPA